MRRRSRLTRITGLRWAGSPGGPGRAAAVLLIRAGLPGLLRLLGHGCTTVASARDFSPFKAASMIIFSARRLNIPIIGIRIPTASS